MCIIVASDRQSRDGPDAELIANGKCHGNQPCCVMVFIRARESRKRCLRFNGSPFVVAASYPCAEMNEVAVDLIVQPRGSVRAGGDHHECDKQQRSVEPASLCAATDDG